MYARLAYIRLRAALFDDAGSLFQKSKLDPRFVVSLFPKYAGRSIPDDQELVIWRGLLHDLTEVRSIDEIGKSIALVLRGCSADVNLIRDVQFTDSGFCDSEEKSFGNLWHRRFRSCRSAKH